MSPLVALVTFPVRWWLATGATPDLEVRPATITYVGTASAADLRRRA
jgi:hypothetical protein